MTATPIFDDLHERRVTAVHFVAAERRLWEMTLEEAFLLACLFIGAWTIGRKIGEIIGDKINAATGRDVPAG